MNCMYLRYEEKYVRTYLIRKMSTTRPKGGGTLYSVVVIYDTKNLFYINNIRILINQIKYPLRSWKIVEYNQRRPHFYAHDLLSRRHFQSLLFSTDVFCVHLVSCEWFAQSHFPSHKLVGIHLVCTYEYIVVVVHYSSRDN